MSNAPARDLERTPSAIESSETRAEPLVVVWLARGEHAPRTSWSSGGQEVHKAKR